MSKKYKVELSTLAQDQIVQIARYITEELQSPDAAHRVVDKLETEIGKLETMPERIVLVDEEPWHSKGVHKFIIDNYIAYFVIIEPEGIVRVIAVVLGRMDQKKQLQNTGIAAMERASQIAKERGIDDMTLDEINAEINEARKK